MQLKKIGTMIIPGKATDETNLGLDVKSIEQIIEALHENGFTIKFSIQKVSDLPENGEIAEAVKLFDEKKENDDSLCGIAIMK